MDDGDSAVGGGGAGSDENLLLSQPTTITATITTGKQRSCSLTKERIQKLKSLNFKFTMGKGQHALVHGIFSSSDALSRVWEERYVDLKTYKATYGHTDVPLKPVLIHHFPIHKAIDEVMGIEGKEALDDVEEKWGDQTKELVSFSTKESSCGGGTELDKTGEGSAIHSGRNVKDNIADGNVASSKKQDTTKESLLSKKDEISEGSNEGGRDVPAKSREGTIDSSLSSNKEGVFSITDRDGMDNVVAKEGNPLKEPSPCLTSEQIRTLGRWVSAQRRKFKAVRLTKRISSSQALEHRFQRLAELNFDFFGTGKRTSSTCSMSNSTSSIIATTFTTTTIIDGGSNLVSNSGRGAQTTTISKKNQELWETRFYELSNYVNTHGNANVPHSYKENQPLARWVIKQRESFRSKQRHQLLEQRMSEYSTVVLPEPSLSKKNLSNWAGAVVVEHSRGAKARNNPLTEDRVDRLKEIGFEFSISETTFVDWVGQLKAFGETHGHLNVKQTDDKRLYDWTSRQRNHFRNFMLGNLSTKEDEEGGDRDAHGIVDTSKCCLRSNPMTNERVALLEEIGFDWNYKFTSLDREIVNAVTEIGGQKKKCFLLVAGGAGIGKGSEQSQSDGRKIDQAALSTNSRAVGNDMAGNNKTHRVIMQLNEQQQVDHCEESRLIEAGGSAVDIISLSSSKNTITGKYSSSLSNDCTNATYVSHSCASGLTSIQTKEMTQLQKHQHQHQHQHQQQQQQQQQQQPEVTQEIAPQNLDLPPFQIIPTMTAATEIQVPSSSTPATTTTTTNRKRKKDDEVSTDQAIHVAELSNNGSHKIRKLELWRHNYDQLCLYKDEFGHCRVPGKYSQNVKLGYWVKLQREGEGYG